MRAFLRTWYYRVIAWLARLLTPFRYASYLRKQSSPRLQIGAGPSFTEGWLVTDIEPPRLQVGYLDATKRYPFPSARFDYVHSEHMIEHVPWAGGLAMLKECRRILKPGGTIRIATPDLKVLLDLYYNPESPDADRYVKWMCKLALPDIPKQHPIFVINKAVRAWGHQFFYDATLLTETLQSAGFVDIRQVKPGQSEDPNLRGIEQHGRNIGDEWINQYETMVFEARVPG